jgi:hypothetical protein
MSQPIPNLVRPAFFEGQRLTADDLAAAQEYSRELRWLHNRSLHGWGIALGLAAHGIPGERTVRVSPGHALDCAGRELVLESARVLAVPASSSGTYDLTIAYADDSVLEQVPRRGACGTEGATRIVDDVLVRWIETNGKDPFRPGLDVVLARATVAGCALETLSLHERDELDPGGPYVAAGQTTPRATPWRLWPDETYPAGLGATVSTAEGGFTTTPVYQARLAGARRYRTTIVEGHPVVSAAAPESFEFAFLIPTGDSLFSAAGEAVNALGLDEVLAAANDELEWHVVWLGVET